MREDTPNEIESELKRKCDLLWNVDESKRPQLARTLRTAGLTAEMDAQSSPRNSITVATTRSNAACQSPLPDTSFDSVESDILHKTYVAAAQNEDDEEAKPRAFLSMMVAVTAATGFLMGYDLCIVAVVLGPIRDHFGVCAGKQAGTSFADAEPCVLNELFVAILAPGAMVSEFGTP